MEMVQTRTIITWTLVKAAPPISNCVFSISEGNVM